MYLCSNNGSGWELGYEDGRERIKRNEKEEKEEEEEKKKKK